MKLKQTYWNAFLMAFGGFMGGWQFFKDVRIGAVLAVAAFLTYLLCALSYWKKRCRQIPGGSNLKELESFYSRAPEYHLMSIDKLREEYIRQQNRRK